MLTSDDGRILYLLPAFSVFGRLDEKVSLLPEALLLWLMLPNPCLVSFGF